MQLGQIASYVVLVTAILVAAGGTMGFVKANSKASLIAGLASGAALAGCFAFSMADQQNGLIASIVVLLILNGMFAMRLVKTKKFMPNGLMLIISSVAEIVVFAALLFK
ncbi:MAG: TMEM14 family protein [Candidatus Obscuribacterales bacterium]|nr:TMEM14 family protein [Candidatus Obscuribacterales bacterium]